MEIADVKNIDIVGFLSKKGIQPVKMRGVQYSYLSPLRGEAEPSFSVNINKNRWYDFGLGEGGDIILLVQKMHNIDFKEAMQILSGDKYVTFQPKLINARKSVSSFKINRIHDEIVFYGLMSYLHTRGIDYNLVKGTKQLVEVEFNAKSGKRISALGFTNDNGGVEIRNSFTKISTSPKAISTIPGSNYVLNVFEGFMDFLSALTFYQTPDLEGTSIVLNGVGQKNSLLKVLPEYKEIKLFLDNDEAGKMLVKKVSDKAECVVDYSAIVYPDYKDFNELLIKRKR